MPGPYAAHVLVARLPRPLRVAWDIAWISVVAAVLFRNGPRWLLWTNALAHRLLPTSVHVRVVWAEVPLVIAASFAALFAACFIAVRFLGAPRLVWAGVALAALPFTAAIVGELGMGVIVGVLQLLRAYPAGHTEWAVLARWLALTLFFAGGNVAAAWIGGRTAARRASDRLAGLLSQ